MNRNWIQPTAQLIEAIGTSEFPGRLTNALKALTSFDYSVIFAYHRDARPLVLYDDFPVTKRRIFVTTYLEGPYLLDPFFLACVRNEPAGLYRLDDFAPDRFYQSEYFRSYYVQTGLSDEIGYFVNLPGSVTVVMSLMRAYQTLRFSEREFRFLQSFEAIIRSAATRHWSDLYQKFTAPPHLAGDQTSLQRHIEHAFRTFGRTVLTAREREVVEYVLKGHSSEAIGKILGISSGTVRIHRKSIYAKLSINSQGELFSKFIRALSSDMALTP